jgi:hypothetical protein
MSKTYEEQLDSVQEAIALIESGSQSQSLGNRVYTRADLATLYARETWLRRQVEKEENGGVKIQYVHYHT